MTTPAFAEVRRLVTRALHPAVTSDLSVFAEAAAAGERVIVRLEAPGPDQRTRLLDFVLAAVEAELESRGAAPRGWVPQEPAESILGDQLYRSRLLGASGLALRFSALSGIANARGELDAEDSRSLRRLFALAEREPIQLFVPSHSMDLAVTGAPQRLGEWLSEGSRAGRVASIEYEDLAELCEVPRTGLDGPTSEAGTGGSAPPLDAFLASAEPSLERCAPADAPVEEQSTIAPVLEDAPVETIHPVMKRQAESSPDGEALASRAPMPAEAPQEPAMKTEDPNQRCASWAAQLANMSGPKVHASVERAFLTAYLPLAHEVAAGSAPLEARAAVDRWAEGFAQSYAAAFKSLNSSLRRPRMVRDIFELGARWLGQSRARQCQLLMIDAMRFDLGRCLNEKLERELAGDAACREQTLLWAALPSNAEAQRIGDTAAARTARKDKLPASAPPSAPSGEIQTVRVGSREFFQLDRLASELAAPGENAAMRLERLAAILAEVIVPWIKAQPPDTLIVLFGNHGFYWEASFHGTSPAQRGGALPEQVLVPASAWVRVAPRKRPAYPALH
jgi:hypothetical protein